MKNKKKATRMGSVDYTNSRALSHEDIANYKGSTLGQIHRQRTIAHHNINATILDDSNL